MLVYGLVAVVLLVIGGSVFFRCRGRKSHAGGNSSPAHKSETASTSTSIPFQTDATIAIQDSIFKFAFGVNRIDYRILGDHQRVLRVTEESIPGAMNQPRYFPRKPALLPKLMRAINSLDTGRHEIVRLILQDAALAGNVLRRANSVYYRSGQDIVESVDRAVTILGNEGLRAPVASAVMQPVFQLPGGFFENFAPAIWEQARRTAFAAEESARVNQSADAFVAHLAGMLGSLSRVALFRLTMDKYREKGNLMPRPEVFIAVMKAHEAKVTRDIAAAWEMSDAFLEALDAQIKQTPPDQMTPLANTVYVANLCGSLATLHRHDLLSAQTAQELMLSQGLAQASLSRVWDAAIQTEVS